MQAAAEGCSASQKAREIMEEAAAEAGLIQGDATQLVKVLLAFCLYPGGCAYTCTHKTGSATHALWDGYSIRIHTQLLAQVMGPFLDALVGKMAEGDAQRDMLQLASRELR